MASRMAQNAHQTEIHQQNLPPPTHHGHAPISTEVPFQLRDFALNKGKEARWNRGVPMASRVCHKTLIGRYDCLCYLPLFHAKRCFISSHLLSFVLIQNSKKIPLEKRIKRNFFCLLIEVHKKALIWRNFTFHYGMQQQQNHFLLRQKKR